MSEEKKVFWIASYPKSGNTLFRAIISSLFFTNDGIFSFELFKTVKYFETAKRLLFIKEENPNDFNNLNLKIISKYWLEMQSQKRLNIEQSFTFLKTHSALLNVYGNDFTNPQFSRGLIYLVRDPRDVALSWSKHINKSVDDTIKLMGNANGTVIYNDLEYCENVNITPKILMSRWDLHIKSWEKLNVPKMIIRYEDLIDNKKNKILEVVNFFEKNYGFTFNNIEQKINNIVITTNFKNMKQTEEKEGFEEATSHTKFFNVGKKNQWKDKLNLKQIREIEENFKEEMIKFNYL